MHPVACLALLPDQSWSFWYIRNALQVPDFRPFTHFPQLDKAYHSEKLFPMFANRVMSPRRPDYEELLSTLDLTGDVTPFDILARSSGQRATDSVRLYPEPSVDPVSGVATCTFLAHGVRHVNGADERAERLRAGDHLSLRPEPDNQVDARALLLDNETGNALGYLPGLLLECAHTLRDYRGVEIRVRRVNPRPTPPTYRLLCRMAGPWPPGPLPFTGPDYQPLSQAPG